MLRNFIALTRVVKTISQSTLCGYLSISKHPRYHLRNNFLPSLPYQNQSSTMTSGSAGSSSRAAISTRERILVRYASVHAKGEGYVTKQVILGTIVDAHNGDKSMATEKKYDDERPIARNCFQTPPIPISTYLTVSTCVLSRTNSARRS